MVGTRQTERRGADRKVAGDRKSATFRCHHPATNTQGHGTLHQHPARLLHKKLLTGKVAPKTSQVSLSFRKSAFLAKCVCVHVALLHGAMALAQERIKVMGVGFNSQPIKNKM